MVKPVGGRGKKAPYQTIQMRVPLPLKSKVEELVEQYRTEVLGEPEGLLELSSKPVNRFRILREIADELLADQVVTRNGKDRGSVKRGLEAFIERLLEKLNNL